MVEKLRAVVAARLSRMTESTTSPDSQVTNARAYAEARGWKVVGEASDLDVSASKVEPWSRKELGAWLRRPADFDVLVFRSIDRLARRATDFSRIVEWADSNGIRLVSLSPNIDFSDSVGRLIAAVLAHVAEMESQAIRDRVQGARAFMRQIARWPSGNPPYGYRLCPHPGGKGYALEPDPETSPILLEIVERVLSGEAVHAVVKDLNARGLRTRKGRLWQTTRAIQILRSESLLGLVQHKGAPVLGRDGQPLRYGPALVDEETFRELQAELAKRRNPGRRQETRKALLVGVAFCGVCGEKLYIRGSRGGRRQYGCIARRYGKDCPGPAIFADSIEAWTEEKFLRSVGRMAMTEVVTVAGEDHRRELADIRAQLSRLREHGRRGLYDDALDEFELAVRSLQGRRAELEARPVNTVVEERDTGQTFAEWWSDSDNSVADRRDVLLRAGVEVYLFPTRQGARGWSDRLDYRGGEGEADPYWSE